MLLGVRLFCVLDASTPSMDRHIQCRCCDNPKNPGNLYHAHLQRTSRTFWTWLCCFPRCSLGMEARGEVCGTCRLILPEAGFRSLSRLFETSRTHPTNPQ